MTFVIKIVKIIEFGDLGYLTLQSTAGDVYVELLCRVRGSV